MLLAECEVCEKALDAPDVFVFSDPSVGVVMVLCETCVTAEAELGGTQLEEDD